MLSLQPKCRYITTERSRHFQPVKMRSELNSSTSTDIDEGQAEIQLPPVWKMQKIFTSSGAQRANNGNRKNLTCIQQERRHKSGSSTVELFTDMHGIKPQSNNFMLLDP
jgi:hypothetical protein